jgi:hypothetical protein
MVMSAPEADDWMVLSWLKFPSATPPLVPVVQRVIGPPAVPSNLGLAALAPSLDVIRPADFTRIPPLPAEILAFNEVVAVPRASTETVLPAVVVAPIVMFPPDERETLVAAVRAAEVVTTPAQVTVRSPATLTAPPEFVNSPDPPQFSVRELPAVALLTAAETVMAPALSI